MGAGAFRPMPRLPERPISLASASARNCWGIALLCIAPWRLRRLWVVDDPSGDWRYDNLFAPRWINPNLSRAIFPLLPWCSCLLVAAGCLGLGVHRQPVEAVFAVTISLDGLLTLVIATIFLFNSPSFLVPPALRREPGAIGELRQWRRRRGS